jgi:phosphomannomutase
MDNGIIPFLMIWQLLSESGKTLSQVVAPYKKDHFMIDELKYTVTNPSPIIDKLKERYDDGQISEMDGLTVEFPDWRFNFRSSNTEPAAKLNLEARSKDLMIEKTEEIGKIINR